MRGKIEEPESLSIWGGDLFSGEESRPPPEVSGDEGSDGLCDDRAARAFGVGYQEPGDFDLVSEREVS